MENRTIGTPDELKVQENSIGEWSSVMYDWYCLCRIQDVVSISYSSEHGIQENGVLNTCL